MGGTRVYVYGLLHRSGFVGGVKGIYLSSDDTAHMRNNTENFCVGLFCRWESKVKIWIHVLLKDLLFIGVEPVSILRIKPSSF